MWDSPPLLPTSLPYAAPFPLQVSVPGLLGSEGDFVIHGPSQHGVAGLVNLYGIDSPGTTASLAIARMTRRLLEANKPIRLVW